MLIGEYSHSIDAKGRVFIPAKFREELGENFIVTRGTEECLFVFSPEAWKEFAGKLQHIPVTDVEAQKFLRLQFASATDCTPRADSSAEQIERACKIGKGSSSNWSDEPGRALVQRRLGKI